MQWPTIPMDDPRRPPTGALAYQVGGSHYKDLAIQPVEYSTHNKLGWVEGNIIKHITRHNLDGGKGEQDVQKAAHYCRLLLQLVYGKEQEGFPCPSENRSKGDHETRDCPAPDGMMTHAEHNRLVKQAAQAAWDAGERHGAWVAQHSTGVLGTIVDPLAGLKIEGDSPDKANRREIVRQIALNWYGGRLGDLLQRIADSFDLCIMILPNSEDDPLCQYCGRPESCHDEADDYKPVEPERNRIIAQVRDLALRWNGRNAQEFFTKLAKLVSKPPVEVLHADEDSDTDLEFPADAKDYLEDECDDPQENERLAARMEQARQIDEGELVVIKYLDDEFHLDTVGKINKVVGCARCGHEHDNLPYLPLRNGPGCLTHWAICPTTGEPLMVRRQIEIGKAAEDSPEGDGEVKVKLETPTEKISQY